MVVDVGTKKTSVVFYVLWSSEHMYNLVKMENKRKMPSNNQFQLQKIKWHEKIKSPATWSSDSLAVIHRAMV